ncbi:hypothetical protein SESBI_21210 [Sesbania bispinosa]|nr:hypothetical protein SESBI_21210 [Sesbania bispinosa]
MPVSSLSSPPPLLRLLPAAAHAATSFLVVAPLPFPVARPRYVSIRWSSLFASTPRAQPFTPPTAAQEQKLSTPSPTVPSINAANRSCGPPCARIPSSAAVPFLCGACVLMEASFPSVHFQEATPLKKKLDEFDGQKCRYVASWQKSTG